MAQVKHIGVLTSGGDAPGMNAATRATVRTALANGVRVTGIIRGFAGLISGDFEQLQARSVSNIIQLGGTMLKTSRSDEFYEEDGRTQAAARMADAGIDALVAIGGDGTFRGLRDLYEEHGTPAVGLPGTIDNDIYGTDFTIGFDTAINTALESIDKIRDTAASHDRIFFIEVMGRKCGAIALEVGVSGGAEGVLVPEVPVDLDKLSEAIIEGKEQGKTSYIIVVAEGAYEGGAQPVCDIVTDRVSLEGRVSVLGHVQRGGSPTSSDRRRASRMGRAAVEALLEGERDVMVGVSCGETVLVPLEDATTKKKRVDLDLLKLAEITAT
ncbi:MAG: 6-phosphofructokinase [Candidatus Eisenbacteria bacterium]|nr:6-phosphofructokinase [Candidatus Eisenbacteria bacterium]